ncbi:MAG: uroporphyrinogen-III synthase [Spirochaetia bacterium]|nr:uroporphyrinogen-III synthase [Spirochaetia bacterium]
MINKSLRILTRDSFLAMAQTIQVSEFLINKGFDVQVKALKTAGDVKLDVPLYQISAENPSSAAKEGKAYFTKELEDGLLSGEGDLAVHSLKDLPTQLPQGLSFAGAIMPVETTDTLVAMEQLPTDAGEQKRKLNSMNIGSSSLRRIALVKKWLPQACSVSVRGNLVTRLEKLQSGKNIQSLILATAGLKRLHSFYIYWGENRKIWERKLDHSIIEKMDTDHQRLKKIFQTKMYFYELDAKMFLPAVSQGVLGLESRDRDIQSIADLFGVKNEAGDLAGRIRLERNLLSNLEAGCHIPYGNFVEIQKYAESSYFKIFSFFARSFNPEENKPVSCTNIVRQLPHNYADFHTAILVRELKGERFPVVLCGLENKAFINSLETAGFSARHIPLIESSPVKQETKLNKKYSVAIVTSKNCVDFFPDRVPEIDRWIAVGDKTAEYIRSHTKIKNILVPELGDGVSAAKLAISQLQNQNDILWFGALNGKKDGIDYLIKQGMNVSVYNGYETTQLKFSVPETDTNAKNFLDKISWWVFTSPSSAKSYLEQKLHRSVHLVSAIGNSTAEVFFENGIVPYHISAKSDLEVLAQGIMGVDNLTAWKTTEWSI